MAKIQIIVAVALEHVAALMEALTETGLAESISLAMQPAENIERIMPAAAVVNGGVQPHAVAARKTVRRVLTEGRNLVAYVPAVKLNKVDLSKLDLTPQQAKVALYVTKHPSVTCAEVAEATSINRKSVESALYQLRHTKPALIKSVKRDQ